MIICMIDETAFVGATAEEAYHSMLQSNEDFPLEPPQGMRWFRAQEVSIEMTTVPLKKTKAGQP